MRTRPIAGHLVAAIASLAVPLSAAAVGQYIFTDLGSFPGGRDETLVHDINSYGQVIGMTDEDIGPPLPFLWTPTSPNGANGSMVALGSLPGVPKFQTSVWRINSRGQVIGLSGIAPYIWTPDVPNGTTGAMMIPAGLPSGPPPNFRSINDVGQVVGIAQPTGSGPERALVDTDDA